MSSVRAPRAAPRVVFRPTEPGDLAALAALFDDRFGHPVTAEEWDWKYRRLPGEARSWVAVDDEGRVLAHAGALGLPARVRSGASGADGGDPGAGGGGLDVAGDGLDVAGAGEAPIWQLTDWAGTATATGLRPPLVRLGRRLLADLPRPGDAPWIFGFPSARHFQLGRRVFGYRTLPAVVELAGEIADALDGGAPPLDREADREADRVLDRPPAVPFEHCGEWPEAAEAAWEGCGVLGVRRSAAFLNWRYHARPGRYYRFYRLRAAGDPGVDGLAVFAFVGAEALAAELWLPMRGVPAEAWLPALRAVAADLAASGLTRWRFWPLPASGSPGSGPGPAGPATARAPGGAGPSVDLLGRLGVRATGGSRFMGSRGRTGASGSDHPADPHFYYAMGDYDLV